MAFQSKLQDIIQQAWAEKDLGKAKVIVKDYIGGSRIKSKQVILDNVDSIKSKSRLDLYLANSLLKFEKLSINQ